jgi:hypothetical protein
MICIMMGSTAPLHRKKETAHPDDDSTKIKHLERRTDGRRCSVFPFPNLYVQLIVLLPEDLPI